MNKETLTAKKQELEAKFNALEQKKRESLALVKQIGEEQLKLQGEFRLVEAFLKELEPKDSIEAAKITETEPQ